MATLASLKKQIAALEAQVEQVTKAEMSSAISKIRQMMSEFGVTVEHLAQSATKKVAGSKKATATASSKKGSKAPKYRDPATGATWTGVGRAPTWIAAGSDRTKFLVAKPAAADEATIAAAPAKTATRLTKAKRANAVKVANRAKPAAKQAAVKATGVKKVASPAKKVATPAKKAMAIAKSAVAKKVTGKKAAAKIVRKRAKAVNVAAPDSSLVEAASESTSA